jgi:hypothetical protein
MARVAPSCLVAAIFAVAAYPTLPAAERYRVSDLPSSGGAVSRGNSIDDAGVVLGYSRLPDGQSEHAVAWLFGRVFDLGTLCRWRQSARADRRLGGNHFSRPDV